MADYFIKVCPDPSKVTWLIKGEKNILYEAGMAYSAGRMIERVKQELGGKPLDAIILSHSHYDHVGALPLIKQEWPDVVVYGSEYAAKVLEKPSVRKMIKQLSIDAAKGAGEELSSYREEDLKVDVIVKDGDRLEIGDHTITVYETPGHTKCSVSYLVDDDLLLACETVGVWKGDWYMPCYMVGYEMSVDAVKKLQKVHAKRLHVSHVGIYEGDMDTVWDFLLRKLESTKNEIVEIMRNYETREEQMQVMKELYHDHMVSESEQPSFAFLLNAAATLDLIEKEIRR